MKDQKIKLARFMFCFVFAVCAILSACNVAPEQQRFSQTYFDYFDTVIVLTGYVANEADFDRANELAKQEFQRLHDIFDIYAPHDSVNGAYMLNHSRGESVKIEAELMELLQFAKDRYDQTEGRMNIAMGAVLELWQEAREAKMPPSRDELLEADTHSALSNLELDPKNMTARLLDPDTRVDLGSIAKGFAVEKVAQLLADLMPAFLIDGGGNIRLGDAPQNRDAYNIGIADPIAALNGASEILMTLPLTNAAAVTSGGYQRSFTYDGRLYHHLIDPDTLEPGDFVRQVTIIDEDSGLADLLSTAAFLLPYEESRVLVEKMGVDAVWVLNDGTVEQTME